MRARDAPRGVPEAVAEMLLLLLLLLSADCAAEAGSDASPWLLQDYMRFPARSQLMAFRSVATGDRLVWVELVDGVQNIMLSTEYDGFETTIALTSYTVDDGETISLHGFSSNASKVYYHRGPSDDANPAHLATPPSKVFLAALVPRPAATSGWVPAVAVIANRTIVDSAHGRLLFTRSSEQTAAASGNLRSTGYSSPELWEMDEATGEERMLFRSKHGRIAGISWSPDGRILAFDNHRGDHGFIGLYDYETSALQWVAPSYDVDQSPSWSPSGAQLHWTRLRDMTGDDGRDLRCTEHGYCNRAGAAFSLMVVNISAPTGMDSIQPVAAVSTPREIFRDWHYGSPASGTAGYGRRGTIWVDESELLFGTETSGFVHVVAAPTGGDVKSGTARVRDLTPLLCDNQQWLAHDGAVFVTHNCDNVDSLGVAKIDIKLGGPSRQPVLKASNHTIYGMEGFEPMSKGHVAYFECGVNYMAAIKYLVAGADPKTAHVVAGGGPAAHFVTPSLVTFSAPDGTELHGQLFQAESNGHDSSSGSGGDERPAVLFTHGGCQRQMYATMHYAYDYASLYSQNQYLASRGFVVLSVNYRGGVGYGVKFRAANASNWQGASEYQDVLAAGQYLAGLPTVNASRIGVYGLSYGGLNTMQALARNSDIFAAGVANAPVFNFISDSRYTGYRTSEHFDLAPLTNFGFRSNPYGPGSDLAGPHWADITQANQRLAWESSPAGHIQDLTSPLLVIQGDADANVVFQQTVGIVRTLRRQGLEAAGKLETLVIPDERHGFSRWVNQLLAANKTAEFLMRWLA